MKPEQMNPDELRAAAQAAAWYSLGDEVAAALAIPWRTPDIHAELAAAMAASGVPVTYVLSGVSGEDPTMPLVRWANYEL